MTVLGYRKLCFDDFRGDNLSTCSRGLVIFRMRLKGGKNCPRTTNRRDQVRFVSEKLILGFAGIRSWSFRIMPNHQEFLGIAKLLSQKPLQKKSGHMIGIHDIIVIYLHNVRVPVFPDDRHDASQDILRRVLLLIRNPVFNAVKRKIRIYEWSCARTGVP